MRFKGCDLFDLHMFTMRSVTITGIYFFKQNTFVVNW